MPNKTTKNSSFHYESIETLKLLWQPDILSDGKENKFCYNSPIHALIEIRKGPAFRGEGWTTEGRQITAYTLSSPLAQVS